jgi:DNA-binding NtrC family response regulator
MIDPRLALVVEDDTLQREVLAEHLRDQHMSVIECDSVEAAELVLARTGLELSLLITDVELGQGATGLELAAFALERFPALKVVIVSGNDARPRPTGSFFLRKPYKREELLALAKR